MVKMAKDDIIREIVRFFLVNPEVKWKNVMDAFGLTKRATFRYIEEIKEQLRPVENLNGAYTYIPSDAEIDMSVLMLKRAIEEGQVTDEMVGLARDVINQSQQANSSA